MVMLRLLFLLMLQAGLVVLLEAHNQIPELSISPDKSFKVRVFISHVKENAPKRYRYLIDESYSSEQKRTIIKYKTLASYRDEWFKKDQVPYDGIVILDGHTKPPLVIFANFINEQWCKELDWWKFEKLCHIDVIRYLSNDRELLDNESSRIHGPSNILFWFERVRDQLQPVKPTLGVSVRDVPSEMFKHPFSEPKAQTYTYYAKSQMGKGGKGMPLRITIDFPEGSFVQYDFISPAEVSNEPTQSSGSDYFADELILDEFFIPRASGCSLAGNHSDFTLSNHIGRHDSFSFEARAKAFHRGRDMMSRVAYHKELNMMRADRQTVGGGSNLLVDFNRGRTYRSQLKAKESSVAQRNRFLQPNEVVHSKCIMMASPKRPRDKNNIEFVLLGSQGSWRYLGLARLRGLRVRAYEAYDTQWPMWLQQPILFFDQDNEEQVRISSKYEGEKLSTVVYVLDGAGDGDKKFAEETWRLVGIEIFLIRDSNLKVLKSRSISIFGFDWQVDNLADWPRSSAIFSMADQCAAELSHNEHLQVSMSVVRADNPSVDDGLKDSLLVNKNRDLSLLQSIQNDLGIPSSMLYDLRSEATYQKEATNLLPISMTFRLAKGKQPLVKLHLYGTGFVKADLRSELITLQCSLRDCYNLAAHRRVETFFAFSSKISLCTLDYSEDSVISSAEQQPRPRAFDLSKEGRYEIYLVRHTNEETEPDLITQLQDLSRRSETSESQLMKRLLVPNPNQTMIKISFLIKSFKIFDTTDGPKQSGTTDPGELFNLGLVSDTNLVYLIESEQERSNQNYHKAIDFAACQMACLLDTNCATFSYCLRGSQAECALTSVDFNDANLVFQLIDHFKEQSTDGKVEGREFSLKVDTDKVMRVRQRASCELRTKSYLDLYRKSNKEMKVNFENVIIEPALGGREDCARRCFSETERVLKKVSNITDKIYSNLEEIVANQDHVLAESVDGVKNYRLQASSELCKGFHYIDAINLGLLPDYALAHFEKAMKDLGKELGGSGFCCTKKPLDQRKSTANDEKDPEETVVDFEQFYFKFETIYKKQPGLRLLEGMKTSKELEVTRQLSVFGEIPKTPNDIDLLKGILTRRENTQNSIMNGVVDETVCAEACTLQTLGPWPACRSFDIVILPRGINGTNTICKLNSISYADAVDAKRTDLIDVKSTHVKIQTHYEPKFNIEGLARWRPSNSRETQNRLLTWSISIILVFGLITGLVGGIVFGMRSSIVREHEETLIENKQHSNDDNVENSFNLASLNLAS